ncbi:sensor domain-containing diguanylate cyclase [Congregibacter brevis]|uniref:diguanylate cyclase n=1 Tax=Congregibacter brevis TaxID=3081201 RepID=A0ABZ0IC85_9GAMM|nr:sensor domain-containing diguanylate cyclase [Congregibacter sp. IMCC45268]
MLYPRPDASLRSDWQSVVEILEENTTADHSLLRVAYPTSTEIIAASPSDQKLFSVGHRDHRNGNQYCEEVLLRRHTISVQDAASDARWDGCTERRSGYRAYCGTPLLWPDDEAFGTLDLLKTQAFSDSELVSAKRLLENLGTGISAQLALLYRKQEQQFQNSHDALTGIPNRTLMAELAKQQMRHQQRHGGELWLLLWTVDELSTLVPGGGSGDTGTLLRSITERVRGCTRQSDVLARLDEHRFAILISDANEFIAGAVADRIRRNVRRVSLASTKAPHMSFGMSAYKGEEAFDDWLSRSEGALHAAMKAGGNQTVVRG